MRSRPGFVIPHLAAFDPTSISGLTLWLDASDTATITESSGSVSQWDDKSANNYDFTQATGSAQPTTGTRTQNGLNVLDFTADRMANASVPGDATCTVFIVYQFDDLTDSPRAIVATGGNHLYTPYDNGNWTLYWNGGSANTGRAAATATVLLHTTVINGTSSAFFENGTQYGGTLSLSTNVPGNGITVGANPDGNTATDVDGWIAEILIYNSALGTTDREAVEGYLTSKWGV